MFQHTLTFDLVVVCCIILIFFLLLHCMLLMAGSLVSFIAIPFHFIPRMVLTIHILVYVCVCVDQMTKPRDSYNNNNNRKTMLIFLRLQSWPIFFFQITYSHISSFKNSHMCLFLFLSIFRICSSLIIFISIYHSGTIS